MGRLAFHGLVCHNRSGNGHDWGSSLLYSQDWGKAFGPLVRYGFPGVHALTCILPKLPDGAAESVVGILPQDEEVLRGLECFGKYLEMQ